MTLNYPVTMRLDVKVPMRDGVNLSADLYLPDAPGPFPTVLIRTPYDNNTAPLITRARFLASQGYACVLQDCRGRFDSDGVYYPFHGEGQDGYDTQEWVGRQPWSNGKIGMAGGSYVGLTQWTSAPLRSQHLTCIVPRVTVSDYWDSPNYTQGAFQLGVLATWGMRTNGRTAQSIEYHDWPSLFRTLPIRDVARAAGRDVPFWKDWVAHPSYDDYWRAISNEDRWGEIAVPALNLGGWFDLYSKAAFVNFNGLRLHGRTPAARKSKLICGPWPHSLSVSTKTGDVDFGPGSLVDLDAEEVRWFEYWLKGIDNGIVDEPPLRLFIMGTNVWRDEHEWPLARTDWQRWYFHSAGRANSLLGDGVLSTDPPGDEPADPFTYDPTYPVQTIGGNNCCSPHIVAWGPYDQRPVELRGDVLCYTSPPLAQDLEVTGPIKVILYATTDGPDTDWTAKLVDVRPDGYAMNLTDGIIRARYRPDRATPKLLQPGKVYEYEIDLWVTANVFRAGHRIRVEVASSNFPRFDRNPNTGHEFGIDAELRTAHQTVHHSRACPSHIVLPVIPV
ncbi:MAG: CocE/NonD family hydrolase [Candidatus Latescibacteria bacterium]|nr:CocE/NonD family hydrolase [Candidatus Latescibacterota bacterium]